MRPRTLEEHLPAADGLPQTYVPHPLSHPHRAIRSVALFIGTGSGRGITGCASDRLMGGDLESGCVRITHLR
jgi:hypothetical protein